MTSDRNHSPDKPPSRHNWVALVTSIFITVAWLTKRGVDYLHSRYPNVPLLEALGNMWTENMSPPQVTTTAPNPLVVRDDSAENTPINRITPYPAEEDTTRADFNPDVGIGTTPLILPTPEPQPEPIIPTEPKPGTVYALLVGIDDYPRGIRSLKGCVNDITHFEQYLRNRVEKDDDIPLVSIRRLTNANATRQAIIDAWRDHLGQAGAEDVALFYYSGHGAQSRAPFQFQLLEPDNKLESLVCYDSRTSDWDLADQEIGQLISEVAQNEPHIITIFDCCNSGTVTRQVDGEVVVRQVSLDPRRRTLDTFIVQPQAVKANGQIETLPRGRHVVFSACQAFELAQEKRIDGERRGVFSYYLLDSLQQAESPPTYRDLFKRVNALVRANSTRQSPMVESVDSADLNQPFLSGKADTGKSYFTLYHDLNDGWVIDGGAVHGLNTPRGGMTTWLSLFPTSTDNDDLLNGDLVVGYAKVIDLLPASASVQLYLIGGGSLNEDETYKAIVSAVPVRPMGVQFEGDPTAVARARDVLQTAGVGDAPSIFVAESEGNHVLRLIAEADGTYFIKKADDAFNLAVDASDAQQAVEYLEHIARWQTFLDLENPTTRLPQANVSLDIAIKRSPPELNTGSADAPHLHYLPDELGNYQPPRFSIGVTNRTDRRLYCSILALSQAYGVVHVHSDWVEPRKSFSRSGASRVSDHYHEAGVLTTTDVFKLIVSTDEIDMTLANQEELAVIFARQSRSVAPLMQSQLDALLPSMGVRTFEPDGENELPLRDWFTKSITVSTTRPQESVTLDPSSQKRGFALNETVIIARHSSFRAEARLSTLEAATRDLSSGGRGAVPPIFRQDALAAYPLGLTDGAARGGQPELNVLELSNLENGSAVTADNPLEIHIYNELAADDILLPIGYDDEFYLPLGIAEKTDEGCVVKLHRLPEPTEAGSRTVGGSIRILFQKLVGQRLGMAYAYPQLGMPVISAEKITQYETDPTLIKNAITNSNRTLLIVHGLFDDTRTMTPQIVAALPDRYDLVLTFDYENLDTPIKKNGKHLFDKLSAAGFTADSGKTLDILAHSMGGLVSRSMIEQWGGNAFVSRLLTLGTPHSGTPWARVEDLALVGLTALINGITTVTWPLRVVSALVQAIEKFDTTLDNMNTGSAFLEELNAEKDPNIPYIAVAGDTSLVPEVLVDSAEKPSRLRRLFKRLTGKRIRQDAATLIAFLGAANDIAVSVDSARAIPQERTPQPLILPPIASDHVSFFRSDVGLKTIADNLAQND